MLGGFWETCACGGLWETCAWGGFEWTWVCGGFEEGECWGILSGGVWIIFAIFAA